MRGPVLSRNLAPFEGVAGQDQALSFASPYDTVDFVWSMEDRANSTVHNTHFLRGPSAPSSGGRTATNPTGWNAGEIRETLKQNIN